MRLLRHVPAVLLLISVLVACAPACARPLVGVVSHVTDGDTLWVRPASGLAAVQVRIQGIDAPELCQAFGPQARAALAAHVLHRPVRIAIRARDMYQRSIGTVSVDGEDVGAWLVAGGFAWSSRNQARAGPYAREEAQARQGGAGLWADGAVEPRVFRRRHGSCRPA